MPQTQPQKPISSIQWFPRRVAFSRRRAKRRESISMCLFIYLAALISWGCWREVGFAFHSCTACSSPLRMLRFWDLTIHDHPSTCRWHYRSKLIRYLEIAHQVNTNHVGEFLVELQPVGSGWWGQNFRLRCLHTWDRISLWRWLECEGCRW